MIWQNSEVIIYISFSFLFLFGLITQGRSVGKYHMTMSQSQSHDEHGKIVHRPCSSCISSIGKSNRDSIEFSLSIAKQRAVGFIPAWSLAFLHNLSFVLN